MLEIKTDLYQSLKKSNKELEQVYAKVMKTLAPDWKKHLAKAHKTWQQFVRG